LAFLHGCVRGEWIKDENGIMVLKVDHGGQNTDSMNSMETSQEGQANAEPIHLKTAEIAANMETEINRQISDAIEQQSTEVADSTPFIVIGILLGICTVSILGIKCVWRSDRKARITHIKNILKSCNTKSMNALAYENANHLEINQHELLDELDSLDSDTEDPLTEEKKRRRRSREEQLGSMDMDLEDIEETRSARSRWHTVDLGPEEQKMQSDAPTVRSHASTAKSDKVHLSESSDRTRMRNLLRSPVLGNMVERPRSPRKPQARRQRALPPRFQALTSMPSMEDEVTVGILSRQNSARPELEQSKSYIAKLREGRSSFRLQRQKSRKTKYSLL